MIYITEQLPTKLSGLSSLYISFDYNTEVVTTIKNCTKYVYNPKTFVWEVSISDLAYLLDNLTYLDDITLKLLVDDESKERLIPKLTHKYPPFQHQIDAITFGLNIDSFALLDTPGAGKTNSAIYLAEELKAQKQIEHCLVICGINTLKTNWKKEIQKFSSESVRILGERVNRRGRTVYDGIKVRAAELLKPIEEFFIIINIETLRSDVFMDAVKKTPNKIGMIILDEAHRIKNPGATQSHNLLKLHNYPHKLALTGTPVINNPTDCYSMLKWIGAEKSNFSTFKSQYCVFGGFGGHQVIGYKNIDMLKEELSAYSLRRTKADLKDFLPKTIIIEVLDMDPSHAEFYESITDGVKEACDKINLDVSQTLALTTRLRQATSCPSLLTSNSIESTKIKRAIELIEDICSNDEKVVVMSTFKEPLNVLYDMLKRLSYKVSLNTGDIDDTTVTKNIEKFQNDPSQQVFLATSAKCGTGITLNAASYMICIDTPFTHSAVEQMEDRINRITNTSPATIYRLICKDTIDEYVEQIVELKEALSEYIVDDKLTDNGIKILQNYIENL